MGPVERSDTDAIAQKLSQNGTVDLLSGRWFKGPGLGGPWTFVASNALPADFARIPPQSLAGEGFGKMGGRQVRVAPDHHRSAPATRSLQLVRRRS